MAERIVVALGGNALGKTPEQQLELVRNTARPIVDLVGKGYEVIIGHGNSDGKAICSGIRAAGEAVRQGLSATIAEEIRILNAGDGQ